MGEAARKRGSRRPSLRQSELAAALDTFTERGMTPCSVDVRPDGTVRWHFTSPADSAEDDLDRELRAFEAEHGHG